jgi:hypothetical protein
VKAIPTAATAILASMFLPATSGLTADDPAGQDAQAAYEDAQAAYSEALQKLETEHEGFDPAAFMDEAMERQMQGMHEMLMRMAEPEIATAFAKLYRALYDALLAEGFTRDEAMQILANLKIGNSS